MGKIIRETIRLGEQPPQLSAAELARMDDLAEKGGDKYYEDIPEMDEEFFENASFFGPEEEAKIFAAAAAEADKETVSLQLTPQAAAYIRSRGPMFRSRLGAVLEAYVAQAEQSEQGP